MSSENGRTERRVKSKGEFGLLVNGCAPIMATVYDVSPSGICLETQIGIACGTPVTLDGDGIIAEGVVRYCRAEGERYRIGIALQPHEPACQSGTS
jgi:hypothetical protein